MKMKIELDIMVNDMDSHILCITDSKDRMGEAGHYTANILWHQT